MRGQLKLKMKASLRVVLLLSCVTLVLFGEVSCRRLHGGSGVQDGDCVPPQDMVNLKLIVAAVEGDLEKMSTMTKAGADVNVSDELFGTPMVAAVYSGKLDAIKLLLNEGANANATDVDGCSALMIAAIQQGKGSAVVGIAGRRRQRIMLSTCGR